MRKCLKALCMDQLLWKRKLQSRETSEEEPASGYYIERVRRCFYQDAVPPLLRENADAVGDLYCTDESLVVPRRFSKAFIMVSDIQ